MWLWRMAWPSLPRCWHRWQDACGAFAAARPLIIVHLSHPLVSCHVAGLKHFVLAKLVHFLRKKNNFSYWILLKRPSLLKRAPSIRLGAREASSVVVSSRPMHRTTSTTTTTTWIRSREEDEAKICQSRFFDPGRNFAPPELADPRLILVPWVQVAVLVNQVRIAPGAGTLKYLGGSLGATLKWIRKLPAARFVPGDH